MKPYHERPPTELMQNYWTACRRRGEQCKRVFGVVAMAGALQPKGYVIGWAVGRGYAELVVERQTDKDKWEILEFMPDAAPI